MFKTNIFVVSLTLVGLQLKAKTPKVMIKYHVWGKWCKIVTPNAGTDHIDPILIGSI